MNTMGYGTEPYHLLSLTLALSDLVDPNLDIFGFFGPFSKAWADQFDPSFSYYLPLSSAFTGDSIREHTSQPS